MMVQVFEPSRLPDHTEKKVVKKHLEQFGCVVHYCPSKCPWDMEAIGGWRLNGLHEVQVKDFLATNEYPLHHPQEIHIEDRKWDKNSSDSGIRFKLRDIDIAVIRFWVLTRDLKVGLWTMGKDILRSRVIRKQVKNSSRIEKFKAVPLRLWKQVLFYNG